MFKSQDSLKFYALAGKHEYLENWYKYLSDKALTTLSEIIIFPNTDAKVPPRAIVKVCTMSGWSSLYFIGKMSGN